MNAFVSKPPRLRQDHRLRKHADYQRVYKTGRKQFGKQMAYFFAPQPAEAEAAGPRVGLTVPKALGKAVDRNRIKRRLRAALRDALPLLSASVDVVLHPRRSVIDCEFGAIVREVMVILRAVQAAAERGPEAFNRPPQAAGRVAGPGGKRQAGRAPKLKGSL